MGYKDPVEQRAFQRNWLQTRREAWLKEHGPCAKCGSWKNLQVDHRDPKKKVSHKIWSWAKHRREAELAKCQVLCEECHRDKTAENVEGTFAHSKAAIDAAVELHRQGKSFREAGRITGICFQHIHRAARGETRTVR